MIRTKSDEEFGVIAVVKGGGEVGKVRDGGHDLQDFGRVDDLDNPAVSFCRIVHDGATKHIPSSSCQHA